MRRAIWLASAVVGMALSYGQAAYGAAASFTSLIATPYPTFQPFPPGATPGPIMLGGNQYDVAGTVVRFQMTLQFTAPAGGYTFSVASDYNQLGTATVDIGTVWQGIQLYADQTHYNPALGVFPPNPLPGAVSAGTVFSVNYYRDWVVNDGVQTVLNGASWVGHFDQNGTVINTNDPAAPIQPQPPLFYVDTSIPAIVNVEANPNPFYTDVASIGSTVRSANSQCTTIQYGVTENCLVSGLVQNSAGSTVKVLAPHLASGTFNTVVWDGTGWNAPGVLPDDGHVYGDDTYSILLAPWRRDTNGTMYNPGTVTSGQVVMTSAQCVLSNLTVNPSTITLTGATNQQLTVISANAYLLAKQSTPTYQRTAPLANLNFDAPCLSGNDPFAKAWAHFHADVISPSGQVEGAFGDDLGANVDSDAVYIQDGTTASCFPPPPVTAPTPDGNQTNDLDMAFAWGPLTAPNYAYPLPPAGVSPTPGAGTGMVQMSFLWYANSGPPPSAGQHEVRVRYTLAGKKYVNSSTTGFSYHADVDYARGLLLTSNPMQAPVSIVVPTPAGGDNTPPQVVNHYPSGSIPANGFSNSSPAWVQITDADGVSNINLSLSTSSITVVYNPGSNQVAVPGTGDNNGTDTVRFRPAANYNPLPGPYGITGIAYDVGGNQTPYSFTFTVQDNQPPIGDGFTFHGSIPFSVQQLALITGPTPIYQYNPAAYSSNYFSGFDFSGNDGSFGTGISFPTGTTTPGVNNSYALVTDRCTGLPAPIGNPTFAPIAGSVSTEMKMSYAFPTPLPATTFGYNVDVYWWDNDVPQNVSHYTVGVGLNPAPQTCINMGGAPVVCATIACSVNGTPVFATPSIPDNAYIILTGNLTSNSGPLGVGTVTTAPFPTGTPFGPYTNWVGPILDVTPGAATFSGSGAITVRAHWSPNDQATAVAMGANPSSFQLVGFNGTSWQPLGVSERGQNNNGQVSGTYCADFWMDTVEPASGPLHTKYAIVFSAPTPTFTVSPTSTPSPSLTATSTVTATLDLSATPTFTFTGTITGTFTYSATITNTFTFTATPTATASFTPTFTLPAGQTTLQSSHFFDPRVAPAAIYPFERWEMPTQVKVTIYNVNGDVMRAQSNTEAINPLSLTGQTYNFWQFNWDGRNDSGEYVKNGLYIIVFDGQVQNQNPMSGTPTSSATHEIRKRLVAVLRSGQ